jgi:hypothetical protein
MLMAVSILIAAPTGPNQKGTTQGHTEEPGRETSSVERRERPPINGASPNRLIGSYLAKEWAICRIVDGFVFEAVGHRATSAYGTNQTCSMR